MTDESRRDRLVELLALRASGDSSSEDRRELDSLTKGDPDLAAIAESDAAVDRLLRHLLGKRMSSDEFVRRAADPESFRQEPRLWRVFTVAASLLVSAAVVWMIVSSPSGRPQEEPAGQEDRLIADLIERLGAEEIEEREKAGAELVRLGDRARPALRKALQAADPEIAGRAKDVLRAADPRRRFVSAMAKVRERMPAEEVEAILGKPDDVRTRNDPGGTITTTRTREIWCYGTNGHLTFPTLGRVYIDTDGKAQYIFGDSGEPPDVTWFDEEDLRELLRTIDLAPGLSGWGYDPSRLIRVVNALQPLGKDRALAAIDEYLRVASAFHGEAREGLFLVLRVLFEIPADTGCMPYMAVGGPIPGAPGDPKVLPRFPILLQDDIPFLVVEGYVLAGRAEPVERHVEFFRQKGMLRAGPLRPADRPQDAVGKLMASGVLGYAGDDEDRLRSMTVAQLLWLADSVYRVETGPYGTKDLPWPQAAEALSKLDIRWDGANNRYVFMDGTCLPEAPAALYRRQIWKPELPGSEVEVVVERTDRNFVRLAVEWTEQAETKVPSAVIRLYEAGNAARPLATFEIEGSAGGPRGGALHSGSRTVPLADGKEVQAEMTFEGRTFRSPVYKP